MSDINKFSPITGRHIKEDGTTLNIADTLEGIASGGVQLSGSKAVTGEAGAALSFVLDDDGIPVLRVVNAESRALVTIPVHVDVALRDTVMVKSAVIDVSAYSKISLYISNKLDNDTHNADPEVYILDGAGSTLLSATGGVLGKRAVYSTYGLYPFVITPNEYGVLNGGLASLRIGIKATNAPTMGVISVSIIGTPN